MADIVPPPTLSDYERAEIRGALGFHFDDYDCREELGAQTLILETVVTRILGRRAFAAQAQQSIDGLVF